MSKLILITTPVREFKGHEDSVGAVAVFPDKRRMITSSKDKTLRLWDLKTGVELKKMKEHRREVWRLAVSRDGQLIASGDAVGEIIIWHGETGEALTRPIKAHSSSILSLDFSPDGEVLATASGDRWQMKLWNTKTWEQQGQGYLVGYASRVCCMRYSPSGEFLAFATHDNVEIYNSGMKEHVASFKAHTKHNLALAWMPDGTRLLTGGDTYDPTIREWDTTTWKQVGDPWTGHTSQIHAIAINPACTFIASASYDNHVRLWQLSDRQTVAIFKHSFAPGSVTFSLDGKYILSRSDKIISKWAVHNNVNSKILAIATARDACIDGDLSTAEELLTQNINTKANHNLYAHRSFIMARKHDWDHALQDAVKSISIWPSLIGYISKGIALCGKGHIRDARITFDVASAYTDQDPDTVYFLLLIKAIAFFNADRHDEAMLLLKELAAGCPNADTRHILEVYLRVQLGIRALDDARRSEAAEHFTAALYSSNLSSKWDTHGIYEDLVVLFGWDLKSFLQKAHQDGNWVEPVSKARSTYLNTDLPPGCHKDGKWARKFLPTIFLWLGAQDELWTITDAKLLHACQEIFKVVYPNIRYKVVTSGSVFDVVTQSLNEWRSNFGSTALAVVINFLNSNRDTPPQSLTKLFLHKFAFLYPDPENINKAETFHSAFVQELLATAHLSRIIGHADVPALNTDTLAKSGIAGALGLCAASLEYAFTLVADNTITIDNPRVPTASARRKARLKIPQSFNNVTGTEVATEHAFSVAKWGLKTASFIQGANKKGIDSIQLTMSMAYEYLEKSSFDNHSSIDLVDEIDHRADI